MSNQFSPWTEEEKDQLRQLAGTRPSTEIAKIIIGRNANGIQKQIQKLGLSSWQQPGKARPTPRPVASSEPTGKEVAQPKPKPVQKAVERPMALRKKEPKRPVVHGQVEWCPSCHSPVSNWIEHRARIGCERPAA